MNNIDLIKKLVGNKIFSAQFYKKNGELRNIHCRLGVTKHLKGGHKKYDSDSLNYLTVFDLQKKQYRTINLSTLKQLKVKGEVIEL